MKDINLSKKGELPKVIMTIGIPGSGKSTWAKKQDMPILSADDARRYLEGDVSDQKTTPFMWKAVMYASRALLNQDIVHIIDGTNCISKERVDIFDHLPPCWKVAVIFPTGSYTAIGRIERGIRDGEKRAKVPRGAVKRLEYAFHHGKDNIFNEFDEVYICNENFVLNRIYDSELLPYGDKV